MMVATLCAHDLNPASCADCRGIVDRDRLPDWHTVAVIAAAYDGDCPACDEPIDIGDPIAVQLDGDTPDRRYIHDRCRDD